MTQSEESEFVQYSSGLMAAESVVNIDPRHMKDVVMSGHLPIKDYCTQNLEHVPNGPLK